MEMSIGTCEALYKSSLTLIFDRVSCFKIYYITLCLSDWIKFSKIQERLYVQVFNCLGDFNSALLLKDI